jgi:hypothetical protein
MCPSLGRQCVCWVRVLVRLSLTNIIIRCLCIGVPVVGAGDMWGCIMSALVPGLLSVIYQLLMRLIMVPVLDLVLIHSAWWELLVHHIKYSLRGLLIIGLALRSVVIW